MKLYLAPLEGITGYIYRKALYECFGGFDKYFIPFIRAKQNLNFSSREKKDISPENNQGMYAVPQILTKNADDFLRTASMLAEYGYREVNFNLGCPSKTVTAKGCGAGFLDEPDELCRFLDHIFEGTDMKISIKTRLGMDDADEFMNLMKIYNKFPLEELIIHPRVQKDFYKNIPKLDVFEEALAISSNPVCYNGDIFSKNDQERLHERFPAVECYMMGRGVLADPSLARRIKNGKAADQDEIRRFHDLLYHSYCEQVSGDRNVLFKMKELWFYLAPMFEESKKYIKKIKKSERCAVYESAVNELFVNCRYIGASKQ